MDLQNDFVVFSGVPKCVKNGGFRSDILHLKMKELQINFCDSFLFYKNVQPTTKLPSSTV